MSQRCRYCCALINVTQTRHERVVGGLSVLAMADKQK